MTKTKKILSIILLTLLIISIVFSLAKKVGLCASSETSVDGFYPITEPLPINGSYFGSSFNVNQEVIDSVLDVSTNSYDSAIVVYEESTTQNYVTFEVFQFNNGFEVLGHHSNGLEGWFTWRFNVSHTCHVKYDFNNNTASVVGNFGGGNSGTGVSYNSFSQLPNNQYYLPYHTYCFEYPVWVNGGSLSYNGTTYFQNYVVDSFSGHSKGGVLSNYIDSDDLIEQDSSLPTVDTTSPADPSSNSGWFQKILNGLSKINQSIKGGVLTIGDYIGQGFENLTNFIGSSFQNLIDNIQDFFGDVKDKIDDFNDMVEDKLNTIISFFHFPSSQEVSDFIDNYLDGTPLGDLVDFLKVHINNIANLLGVGVVVPTSLKFDFTLNLLGVSIPFSIDFSWYTVQVRNAVITAFLVFFYPGLFLHFLFQIPAMLQGASGAEKDMHISTKVEPLPDIVTSKSTGLRKL